MEKFVDVILPLPLHACFTYSLPEDMAGIVQIGCRVVVPFGRKKYYTAIVQNIHYSAPAGYEVKEVSALLDAHPILLPEQFRFWDWLADYYLCTRGDVYTEDTEPACRGAGAVHYETGEGERHQEYPVRN